MKIKKISLLYRPIPDLTFNMEPKEFNLIYGPRNGSGKTKILNCLTARIFGKSEGVKNSDIDGSLLIEENGKPTEAKGDEKLFETHYNLDWKTVKNIFFCLEGDLEIEGKEELWKTCQERLSEFAGINLILEEVKKRTYHTPKLRWKRAKAKERNKLEDSIKTINRILNSDAYDTLRDYYRAKRKSEKLEKVIAKKAYEETSRLKDKLTNVRGKIKEECGQIGEVGETEAELTRSEQNLENANKGVQETKGNIKEIRSNIEDEEEKGKSLVRKKERFSDYNHEHFSEEVEELKEIEESTKRETLLERNTWIAPSTFVMGVLSVLMGIVFTPFLLPLGILLVVPAYALFVDRKRSGLEEERKSLLEKFERQLAPYLDKEPEFGSAQRVRLALQRIEKKIKTIGTDSTRAESAKKTLEKTEQNRKKALGGKKSASTRAKNTLKDFLQQNGCEEVEELKEKLEKKKSLEEESNQTRNVIIGLLGEESEENWESKMEEFAEKFEGYEKDKYQKLYEKNLDELKKMRKKNESHLDELSDEAEDYKKEIYQQVDSLAELPKKKKENEKCLKKLEDTFEAGGVTISILNDMLSGQKNLLRSIFTDGSDSITEQFKEVTGGRFTRVYLKEEKIMAETKGGKLLQLPLLSGGEKEILLILIRTILGKKILGKKTFFFLDAPLLHTDKIERRKKAIQALKKIMDGGWQIFYFTHDDYSCDLIREIIPSDKLEEKELKLLEKI